MEEREECRHKLTYMEEGVGFGQEENDQEDEGLFFFSFLLFLLLLLLLFLPWGIIT